MNDLLDTLGSTAEIAIPTNPLDRIVGQEHAVSLVKSAVLQRRHVLLCGVPGVGKSMLAKAASSLLFPPNTEIVVSRNPSQPDRPIINEEALVKRTRKTSSKSEFEVSYTRPEDLPFEVAVQMGYRCLRCGEMAVPSQSICMDCGYPKRTEVGGTTSYVGLLRELDVISEPALTSVTQTDANGDRVTFRRSFDDTIMVIYNEHVISGKDDLLADDESSNVLVSRDTPRFVHVSGFSPVELLGDVKHDPYGSAENLGLAPHKRVVPGAIHEAHHGILYIDEIASLGRFQKHLLTAMQDKRYPISGHNPQSSGASVRVDDVPCDFILFAACNTEDLPSIIPPLRSRIRGYGYEILLNSWMPKNDENTGNMLRFIAQTVVEDGKIPHLSVEAVGKVLEISEELAYQFDGKRDALTLRLRELGGLIRIAGDLAVQEDTTLIEPVQVQRASSLCRSIDPKNPFFSSIRRPESSTYGDYFF